MFRFANIEYLWLLLVIPVLVVAHILYSRHKRRQLQAFGDPELVRSLMPNASVIRPHVKFAITMVALALLIVGIARPQYGTKEETVTRKGLEVMVALDISNSMKAEDVTPSRLEKAKQMLSKMVDNMVDDKVGLVVFAGEAYTQLPITCDYVSAKMFFQHIEPELIQAQGTAIGTAINTCMQAFEGYQLNEEGAAKENADHANRVLIIITDGEDHEDDSLQAALEANKKGVRVFVIGIGDSKGAPIPDGKGGFKKDLAGQTVVSRLNQDMCIQIAEAGSGIYIHADNTNSALRSLQHELDKIGKEEIDTKVYTEYNEQYQSFILIAFLLLIVEFFVFSRKNKFITRMDIFNEHKQ